MKKLVIASANQHKIKEIFEILEGQFPIISMYDIGCREELPETMDTIEGNAVQKADYLYEHYQVDCFSEDTGLEITALNGEPGVKSARYAGDDRDSEANIDLVLEKLQGQSDRSARFRTVIALWLDGNRYTFEGIAPGGIITERRGTGGFGYDPVFLPDGCDQTFGEMPDDLKNRISHRYKALMELKKFLQATNYYNS
jgi:XTP/dITP diphosphohydrolase